MYFKYSNLKYISNRYISNTNNFCLGSVNWPSAFDLQRRPPAMTKEPFQILFAKALWQCETGQEARKITRLFGNGHYWTVASTQSWVQKLTGIGEKRRRASARRAFAYLLFIIKQSSWRLSYREISGLPTPVRRCRVRTFADVKIRIWMNVCFRFCVLSRPVSSCEALRGLWPECTELLWQKTARGFGLQCLETLRWRVSSADRRTI